MVRVPMHREPTHPGEMLVEEFLKPMGLTQRDLADAIRVPYQRVNELTRRRRGITPSTALRLAKYFGMSPDFWLNLQLRWDLYRARAKEEAELSKIRQVKSKSAARVAEQRGTDDGKFMTQRPDAAGQALAQAPALRRLPGHDR
jgi:addiction module HigA family antidote